MRYGEKHIGTLPATFDSICLSFMLFVFSYQFDAFVHLMATLLFAMPSCTSAIVSIDKNLGFKEKIVVLLGYLGSIFFLFLRLKFATKMKLF